MRDEAPHQSTAGENQQNDSCGTHTQHKEDHEAINVGPYNSVKAPRKTMCATSQGFIWGGSFPPKIPSLNPGSRRKVSDDT